MPTATTLAQIFGDVVRDLGQTLGQLSTAGTTTSAGAGGGTSLIDSALTLPDAGTGLLDGVWVYFTSGAQTGKTRIVRKAGFDGSTGTITIAAAPAQIATSVTYLLCRDIHPSRILLYIQEALRLIRVKQFYPWTLLTNGDFATVNSGAGVGSWTYTNCDITGTSGYANSTALVRHGQYSARALLTGSGGNLLSATVPVIPGGQYFVSVALKASVGTGTLRVVDITVDGTGATKMVGWTDVSYAGREWVEAAPPLFVIPTGTYQIAVKLLGTSTSDSIYFDDAILWRYDQRDFLLPSWVEDPSEVEIGYFLRGRQVVSTGVTGQYIYDLDQSDFVTLWGGDSETDESVASAGTPNPFRMRLSQYSDRPLYIYGYMPAPTLSANTDSTTVDRELLVKMTMWLIFNDFATTALNAGKPDEKAGWLERRENVGRDARLAGALTRFSNQGRLTAQGLRPGRW